MSKIIIIKQETGGGGGGGIADGAEGIQYAETVASSAGFSVGQPVRKTSTGWAVSSYDGAETARCDGIVTAIPNATSLTIAGKGSTVTNVSNNWTPGLIGYVGLNGAIQFTRPTGSVDAVWAAEAIFTISSSQAIVLSGEPEPGWLIAFSELAQVAPGRILGNLSEVSASAVGVTLSDLAVALSPLLNIAGPTESVQQIAGTEIDFLVASERYKVISANTTFTLTNVTEGRKVRLYLTNTGSFTATITGVSWTNNAAATLTANRTDIWELARVNGVTYARVISTGHLVDTTPPTLSAFTVPIGDEGAITFTESEPLQIGAGGSGGWTVSASGGAVTVTAVNVVTRRLTLSRNILQGETLTISYVQPGSGIEDVNGNDLLTITDAAVANNSGIGTWIGRYKFNGTGVPAGFPAASADRVYDYATAPAPLEGSGSLALRNAASVTPEFGSTVTAVYIFARIYVPAASSSDHITFFNSSGQAQARITFRNTAIRIEHGVPGVLLDVSGAGHGGAGTVLWIEYEAAFGAGNNGVLRLYRNTNSTSATKPTLAGQITTGTGGAVSKVSFYGRDVSTMSVFDDIAISSTPIGSNPA